VTKLIGGLAFATVKANYYKRGLLQVFQPSPKFRWVAPGCSATGATADGALARLRARVIVASKELK
jgi:hypothetical protein